jgi:WD40 repeat protein
LSEDASITKPGDWTVEVILEEKKQYDISLAFEKKTNEGKHEWTNQAPVNPTTLRLSNSSNVLCVTTNSSQNEILTTHADKSLNHVLGRPPYDLSSALSDGNDAPILSINPLQNAYLLSTSMSGQLALRDAQTGNLIAKRRDHRKMAIQVVAEMVSERLLIITAGWDQRVLLYVTNPSTLQSLDEDVDSESGEPNFFGDPVHMMTLTTVPESILLVRHPETQDLYLVLSRRDSSFIYYYHISIPPPSRPLICNVTPAGRQNLAPHSNAWVAFTPSCLSISPKDPTLLAVATSHLPHMKLIIVRLLFPSQDTPVIDAETPTPSSMARADLALQDREDTAISLHVTTLAPQTPYSTPRVVWRPDATGVWVNGDDGVIRGIEVKTGKIVSLLNGHEPASKVRTLWAGYLSDEAGNQREVLISGGFDKQVLVWDCEIS